MTFSAWLASSLVRHYPATPVQSQSRMTIAIARNERFHVQVALRQSELDSTRMDRYRTSPREERFWEVLDAYLKNIVEHGQDTVYTSVYPGANGPVDAIRGEVFASSLQDYALLQGAALDREAKLLADFRSFEDFLKTEAWIAKARREILFGGTA